MSTEFTQITRREFDTRIAAPDVKAKLFCEVWCEGQVITRLDTLDVKFNYDLADEYFYINMNEKVFTLKSDFIIGFIINERSYIRYNEYQDDKVMILESLVRGDYALYNHHGLEYRAPDFDPVLNIGSKEAAYKKTSAYYAFCDNRLLRLSSKPKKAIKLLRNECGAPRSLNHKGDIVDLFRLANQ